MGVRGFTLRQQCIQCRRLGGAVAQHGNVRDAGGASAVFIYLGIPRYCVYAESPDPEKQ